MNFIAAASFAGFSNFIVAASFAGFSNFVTVVWFVLLGWLVFESSPSFEGTTEVLPES